MESKPYARSERIYIVLVWIIVLLIILAAYPNQNFEIPSDEEIIQQVIPSYMEFQGTVTTKIVYDESNRPTLNYQLRGALTAKEDLFCEAKTELFLADARSVDLRRIEAARRVMQLVRGNDLNPGLSELKDPLKVTLVKRTTHGGDSLPIELSRMAQLSNDNWRLIKLASVRELNPDLELGAVLSASRGYSLTGMSMQRLSKRAQKQKEDSRLIFPGVPLSDMRKPIVDMDSPQLPENLDALIKRVESFLSSIETELNQWITEVEAMKSHSLRVSVEWKDDVVQMAQSGTLLKAKTVAHFDYADREQRQFQLGLSPEGQILLYSENQQGETLYFEGGFEPTTESVTEYRRPGKSLKNTASIIIPIDHTARWAIGLRPNTPSKL
ncbi:hypothetical protein GCM10007047_06020 [Cerasicoccus arenae]|uniref:Uncharacterized protein n=1 Tax=Cerasicoccus arenae TaxID=424488 RepID=A0A8J3DA08_9BACT|nr:hypothetical protein GCM10007047_06020 [Cerasicoccus arenae]